MNLLVCGAGVLGSFYAARLQLSGEVVTILARGQRLAELRKYGIVLEDPRTCRRTIVPVDALESIDGEAAYDVAMVFVRKNQLANLLPMLALSRHTPSLDCLHSNLEAGAAPLS